MAIDFSCSRHFEILAADRWQQILILFWKLLGVVIGWITSRGLRIPNTTQLHPEEEKWFFTWFNQGFFLLKSEKPALMDQFDVIANQPIVIDNVCSIFKRYFLWCKFFDCPSSLYQIAERLWMIYMILLWIIIQGSGVIKAGFAGDQVPKYHFPNL